jgi:hypothetical protein
VTMTVARWAGTRTRVAILAATLVVAAGLAGFLLSRITNSTSLGGPYVTSQLVGVVSKANAGQTNICLTVSTSADAVCSGLWVPGNVAFPAVGARISVWVVRVPVAGGAIDQFILQP